MWQKINELTAQIEVNEYKLLAIAMLWLQNNQGYDIVQNT